VISTPRSSREPFDVYIGRANRRYGLPTSKWANPFRIGPDGTREEVLCKYRHWLFDQPGLMADLNELRGKRLGCWCAPKPCHGHVLIQLMLLDETIDRIMEPVLLRAVGEVDQNAASFRDAQVAINRVWALPEEDLEMLRVSARALGQDVGEGDGE
jgi:hypothetical protein